MESFNLPEVVEQRKWEASIQPTINLVGDADVVYEGETVMRGFMRCDIADRTYGCGAELRHRMATIILGLPGSGKSTLAEQIAKRLGALIVDADLAKPYIPEYCDGAGNNVVHKEAKLITSQVLARALQAGDSIILPTVGRELHELKSLLHTLACAGYSIHLQYVDLPMNKAIRRALRRWNETGRFVDPLYYFTKAGDRPRRNYNVLKTHRGVVAYAAYSSDVPPRTPFDVLESSNTNRLEI